MPRMRGAAAIVLAGVLCVACRPGNTPPRQDGTAGTSGRTERGAMAVTTAGEPPVFVSRDREGARLWDLTRQFYQKRGGAAAWIDGRRPRPQMDALIQMLQRTDREGLDPALYNASVLSARRVEAGRGFLSMKGFDEREAASLDVWLTYLYLQYASDLTNGVANLPHADPTWKIPAKTSAPLEQLEQALAQNHVAESLDGLTPRHAQYTGLRDTLAKYKDIEQRGGWPAMPAQLKLKPGQQNAAVPLLARRLAVTGDYTGTPDEQDTSYSPALQEAVKRFQRRHGLEPDGAISAATVARLNVPVSQRIQQLALNLERWRWLPADLGERYVLVNIPEYRLEVWDHGQVPVSMRVVVGKKDTPTPIFNDDMTHVVFAPYWNVPPDIVKNETVPHALRDPAFLERTNMEVLDNSGNPVDPASIDMENVSAYRFRQRPGSSNSLGLVKFMFPNQFNVYLHDTPADRLFARAMRSFSHGCVRLEQPDKLAQYVLADQPAWTTERIDQAMHGGQETTVKLSRPLPVYLGYWTARISADGILQLRDDLYGIDARQSTILAGALDRLKTRAAAAGAAATAHASRPGSRQAAPKKRP
jgi:murein L,D-transpeptidase YcbB/YkuD